MTFDEIVNFLFQHGQKINRDEATGDIMFFGDALSDGELVNLANSCRAVGSPEIRMVAA